MTHMPSPAHVRLQFVGSHCGARLYQTLLLSVNNIHPVGAAGEDDLYAKEPWRACRAVCLAGHPSLSLTPNLAQRLVDCIPGAFAVLPESTTRKAGKDEVEGVHGFFGCKAADLERDRAAGAALTWRQEGADVFAATLSAAESLYAATGKIGVVTTSDGDGVRIAQAGVPREVVLVHV